MAKSRRTSRRSRTRRVTRKSHSRKSKRRSHSRKSHNKKSRKSHKKSKKSRKSKKRLSRATKGPCAKWKKIDCGRTDASCGWTRRGCVSRRGARAGAVYQGPVMPAQALY